VFLWVARRMIRSTRDHNRKILQLDIDNHKVVMGIVYDVATADAVRIARLEAAVFGSAPPPWTPRPPESVN
jgi:hypothetical protein